MMLIIAMMNSVRRTGSVSIMPHTSLRQRENCGTVLVSFSLQATEIKVDLLTTIVPKGVWEICFQEVPR